MRMENKLKLKTSLGDHKIATIALLLGSIAVFGSLLIGWNVLKITSSEIEHQIYHYYNTKAMSLALLSPADEALSDSELLAEINRKWQSSFERPRDEYICIVDTSSNLLLHSADPGTVGSFVGENLLVSTLDESYATLGELVRGSDQYIGDYISSIGEDQIAAFTPIGHKGWMLGVHRSKELVEQEIRDSLRTEFWGILIVCLLIIPLSLGLLYLAIHRSNMRNREMFEALSREEALLTALMEGSPDHIYFKDLKSRFIKTNKAQSTFLNLNHPDEAVGKTDFDFFPDKHAQAAFDDEQRIIRTGQAQIGDEEHHVKNGADLWISATKLPLKDGNGEIFGTVGISRDISELALAREEFRKQSKFLEEVIESLQHPFMVIDVNDYSIKLANSAAKSKSFHSTTTCYALSHGRELPCESEEHPCPLVMSRDTKKPSVVEHIHLDKDGNPKNFEVHSYPIFNEHGEVVQVIEYSLDISKRKSAEEKLQREYALQKVLYKIARAGQSADTLEDLCRGMHVSLGGILDTSNFFIAVVDDEHSKLSFPFFIDEFDGHPGSVDFGKGLTEYVIRTGKSLMVNGNEMDKMDQSGDIELKGTPSKIWLGTPLKAGSRLLGAIVVQNYSDETHFDKSHLNLLDFVSSQITSSVIAKQADDKLAVSERLKELLLDIITHDLRNPIASIYNFSELASSMLGDNEIIEHIHIGSTKLLKVLDNTTLLSQAVFGESIPLESINLCEMIQGTMDESAEQASKAEMSIEIDCPSDLTVRANPILAEIFKNYISNAIKYAASGKKIMVRVIIEDGVIIRVEDFGKAIPEDQRSIVFDRNIQLAKEKKVGRGLGLAIVKKIAQVHNARVWVEPNTPRGNRFCIHLPDELLKS